MASTDWLLYERLLNNGSSDQSPRDVAITNSVETFVSGIEGDPAYQSDALVNGVNTPIVASRKSSGECEIKAVPGTALHIGDTVYCLSEHWLVVDLYTDKIGVINGVMWLCNDILNFQNRSAKIHTRHCVFDDGSYSKRGGGDIYAAQGTFKVYVSIDADTIKMFLDKRLSFGKMYTYDGSIILDVYKIYGIDIKSKNKGDGSHLMVLNVQRDVYNEERDSIDLNLCDVYKEDGVHLEPIGARKCIITGQENIRIGTKRAFVATFIDEVNVEQHDITPLWNIEYPKDSGIVVNTENEKCFISIPLDADLVGSVITMKAKDPMESYGGCTKEVKVIPVG